LIRYSLRAMWRARLGPTTAVCPQPAAAHAKMDAVTAHRSFDGRGQDMVHRFFRMISARMNRPIRVLLLSGATIAVAALAAACGTQKISVPQSDPTHSGAVLFSQRCAGCHTLSYAGTHGSASNVRTREITNGPNFDQRCERPIDRVLYAIVNGGFSGAIMPQNIVVGQDAIAVAQFVAKYAGRGAPKQPGVTPCILQPIGTLPANIASGTTAAVTPTATAGAGTAAVAVAAVHAKAKAAKSKHH
jgi:hypothetical protein